MTIPASVQPYETPIHNMLCSGWSPERIAYHLQTAFEASVPVEDIRDYRGTIPESELLPVPPASLQERFHRLDLEIDATGEMARVLRMAAERLGVAVSLEDTMGDRLPYVDTAMANYWRMLREYVTTRQTLGELPIAQKETKVSLDAGDATRSLPNLRVLLMQNNYVNSPDEIVVDGTHRERPTPYIRSASQELLSGDSGEDGLG